MMEGFTLASKERKAKVANCKHNKVRLCTHRGKLVVDVSWPDYQRNRIRVLDKKKGNELRLRIELAIAEGSWSSLRQMLLEKKSPELITGRFSAVADEYYESWVRVHNRSIKTKEAFIRRFKERWRLLPIRTFSVRHADDYVKSRKGKVKPATINREVACLKHLLGWAAKREYLSQNPLVDYELLEEEPYARERVTGEMINKELSNLPPVFANVKGDHLQG